MKKFTTLILVFFLIFSFSCNNQYEKIKTNYFDLPPDNSVIFKETLKTDTNNKLTKESVEEIKKYISENLNSNNNPISRGIVSNYFWYVYNALPDFVNKNERHTGYYATENEQSFDEKLIAYSIYRIDRNSENIKFIFNIVKPKLKKILSTEEYVNLQVDQEVNSLIESYERIVKINNYKKLLNESYILVDTATGITYTNGDEDTFVQFNGAYGRSAYDIEQIISTHLGIGENLFGSNNLSFWMRRNHENNMETVYSILKQIKNIYKQ